MIFCVVLQAQVHRHGHNFREVQQCTLLSIKTGGCSEDCSYCPQSSRYDTGVKAQRLMSKDAVIVAAKKVPCFPRLLLLLNACSVAQRFNKKHEECSNESKMHRVAAHFTI